MPRRRGLRRTIDVLQHQPHLIGLGRAEVFVFDLGQARLFLSGQVLRVFAPEPLTLVQRLPHAFGPPARTSARRTWSTALLAFWIT